jgi:hypothetical protein
VRDFKNASVATLRRWTRVLGFDTRYLESASRRGNDVLVKVLLEILPENESLANVTQIALVYGPISTVKILLNDNRNSFTTLYLMNPTTIERFNLIVNAFPSELETIVMFEITSQNEEFVEKLVKRFSMAQLKYFLEYATFKRIISMVLLFASMPNVDTSEAINIAKSKGYQEIVEMLSK